MSARYWIAQHVPDVFRNEPRNVGVVVELTGEVAARFMGERDDGGIDGRRLRSFPYPDVYRQWVSYWRHAIRADALDDLPGTSGAHYRIREGGQVSEVGDDSVDEVLTYLYALLVSDGGLGEALGAGEEAEACRVVGSLDQEITESLMACNLIASDADILVRHPVRQGVTLQGRSKVRHTPKFVQENGRLFVIETVDFTTKPKVRARDHAGWLAYMFRDLRLAREDLESTAVVRYGDEDLEAEEVQAGLAALETEGEVLNWLDRARRMEFVERLLRAAMEEGG